MNRLTVTGRRLASATIATVALLTAAQAVAEVRGLTLDLGNDGAHALRCVMVIAHFMSDDLGTIALGERLALALERDGADGSLFVRSADGRRKPIENIVCGAAADWSQTRGDVPLLPLRASPAERASIACRIARRLTCVVTEPQD